MASDEVYLRPDVQVEPLVDRWYAWTYLVPPAQLARNITERHLKIMDSYIAAPEVHATAVRNPRLLGGPFIDYGGQRVDEIRALRDATKQRAHYFTLSKALVDLDAMLLKEARGFGLHGLYPKVPEALQGLVELVYDLNNHPSFRLIEGLLYRSEYYDPSLQSVMLSITDGDDRPFILSTPRLDTADSYHWQVPFKSAEIDTLFGLKSTPQPFEALRDLLHYEEADAALVRSLVTTEAPPRYEPYRGATARWRYFGHACVLVETATTSILFDPVLSYTYESEVSRYTYQDLPEQIDYVLITHNHQDHVLFETLLQLRHRVRNIVVPRGGGTLQDPSLRQLLEQIGFRHVIELSPMEELSFENGSIVAVPFFGEHCDLAIDTKSAYLVRVGDHSLMFAADSCNIEPALYRHLRKELGSVSALFLGMECVGAPLTWLYGPLLSSPVPKDLSDSRRLNGSNYEQGIDIVRALGCREVYVYAMGQEPWLNYVMSLKYTEASRPIVESNRLIEECHRQGLRAERLFGEREMFLDHH